MFFTQPNASPMTGSMYSAPPSMVPMTDYGPLASQFMTGGQMAHLPQAQYMTSPVLGAFRSSTGVQPFPTMHTQQQSLWQMYLQANMGRLPFVGGMLGDYTVNVYNPAIDQTRNLVMAQRRMQDIKSSIYGAGIDTLAMAPLAALGFAGFGAALALPSPTKAWQDRIRTSRQVQDLSMSKIIGGADMAESIGQGFTLGAARSVDKHLRRSAAGDAIFKEEDYRELLRLGVEHGMFDYSNNAEQYKQVISKLSKETKVLAALMESGDLKEIFQNLEQMQKMGAGPDNFERVATFSRTAARMLGMSYSEAIATYGQQGALTYSQMGLTPYQGSLAGLGQAAGWTMAQRVGLVGRGELARMGNISGLAQDSTASQAEAMQRILRLVLPGMANEDFSKLDPEIRDKFIAGEIPFEALMNTSAQRISGSTANLLRYEGNKDNLTEELFEDLGEFDRISFLKNLATGLGEKYLGKNMSKFDQLTGGLRMLGHSPELARMTATQWMDESWMEGMRQQHENEEYRQEQNERSRRRRERSPTGRLRTGVATMWHEIGEAITDTFAPHGMYEKDYEEGRELERVTERRYGVGFGSGDFTSEGLYRNINEYTVSEEGSKALAELNKSSEYKNRSLDEKRLKVYQDFIYANENYGLEKLAAAEENYTNYGLTIGKIQEFTQGITKPEDIDIFRTTHRMLGQTEEGKRMTVAERRLATRNLVHDEEYQRYFYAAHGADREDFVQHVKDAEHSLKYRILDQDERAWGEEAIDIREVMSGLTGSNFFGRDKSSDTDSLVRLTAENADILGLTSILSIMEGSKQIKAKDKRFLTDDDRRKLDESALENINELADFYGLGEDAKAELEKIYRRGGVGFEEFSKKYGITSEQFQTMSDVSVGKGKDVVSKRGWKPPEDSFSEITDDTKLAISAIHKQEYERFKYKQGDLLASSGVDVKLSEITNRDVLENVKRHLGDTAQTPELQKLLKALEAAVDRGTGGIAAVDVFREYIEPKGEDKQSEEGGRKRQISFQQKLDSTLTKLDGTLVAVVEVLKENSKSGFSLKWSSPSA